MVSKSLTHPCFASRLDASVWRERIYAERVSAACAQVYKGAAHPHSAQQPSDITSRINGSFNESQQA